MHVGILYIPVIIRKIGPQHVAPTVLGCPRKVMVRLVIVRLDELNPVFTCTFPWDPFFIHDPEDRKNQPITLDPKKSNGSMRGFSRDPISFVKGTVKGEKSPSYILSGQITL